MKHVLLSEQCPPQPVARELIKESLHQNCLSIVLLPTQDPVRVFYFLVTLWWVPETSSIRCKQLFEFRNSLALCLNWSCSQLEWRHISYERVK